MNKSIVVKLAFPSLLLAGTAVGCTPTGADRPAAISAVAPARAATKAAALSAEAERALARGKPPVAVARAEAAAALSPRDAGGRLLLGRSYLAAGRFLSAEAAFQDAIALDPADTRAPLKLVLAQIALGKWSEARATIAGAEDKIAPADRGLALALAGQPDEAVAVLEPAARAAGADAKTRQNLALAYALAGRWGDSRAVAAQDVAPGALDARMAEWALFAQPHEVWEQVATLLHVTPAHDPGQPVALALLAAPVQAAAAPAPAAPALAATDPTPAAVLAAADPVPAPEPAPAAAEVAPMLAAATPAPFGPVHLAPPSAGRDVPLLHAVRAPFKQPLLLRARAAAAPAPVVAQRGTGGWAVQLGAYAASATVETAWTRASGRLALLARYAPSRSEFSSVHRLALAGFATRHDAAALCERIKGKGGSCFVRAAAGDTPVQMASRGGAGRAPVRLALR